jgi:RNA polymerase sigma-70 factor (ECF subfamily)
MNLVKSGAKKSVKQNLRPEIDERCQNTIRKFSTGNVRKYYQELGDVDLIIDCQSGIPEAFNELVRRTRKCVIGRLHRLAPNSNDIPDLSQEVLIRVWRSIRELKNPRAFKSWLNQIITNIVNDEFRKRPANMRVISIDEPMVINGNVEQKVTHMLKDNGPPAEEVIDHNVLLEKIGRRIVQLKDPFKTALVLRDVEHLSYHDIAKLTRTRLGTVKSRIARARKQLADMVGGEVQDVA